MVLPPVLVAFAIVMQGWTFAQDLRVGRPARDFGQFFGESFERRTGLPLAVVAGDRSIAALVALTAPSRPSLYLDTPPDYRPAVPRQEIEEKGAVVVWPATDSAGRPPPEILAQFPNLVNEVPQAFSRRFEGRMALTRIGWALVRPHSASASPDLVQPPPPPPQAEPLPQPPPEPPTPPPVEQAPKPVPPVQTRPAQPRPQPQPHRPPRSIFGPSAPF
jgi:outer membrane biosynthesis protein TonB